MSALKRALRVQQHQVRKAGTLWPRPCCALVGRVDTQWLSDRGPRPGAHAVGSSQLALPGAGEQKGPQEAESSRARVPAPELGAGTRTWLRVKDVSRPVNPSQDESIRKTRQSCPGDPGGKDRSGEPSLREVASSVCPRGPWLERVGPVRAAGAWLPTRSSCAPAAAVCSSRSRQSPGQASWDGEVTCVEAPSQKAHPSLGDSAGGAGHRGPRAAAALASLPGISTLGLLGL